MTGTISGSRISRSCVKGNCTKRQLFADFSYLLKYCNWSFGILIVCNMRSLTGFFKGTEVFNICLTEKENVLCEFSQRIDLINDNSLHLIHNNMNFAEFYISFLKIGSCKLFLGSSDKMTNVVNRWNNRHDLLLSKVIKMAVRATAPPRRVEPFVGSKVLKVAIRASVPSGGIRLFGQQ